MDAFYNHQSLCLDMCRCLCNSLNLSHCLTLLICVDVLHEAARSYLCAILLGCLLCSLFDPPLTPSVIILLSFYTRYILLNTIVYLYICLHVYACLPWTFHLPSAYGYVSLRLCHSCGFHVRSLFCYERLVHRIDVILLVTLEKDV